MSEARPMDPTLVDLPIGIRAETSLADPDTCKFTVSRTLHPGGPFFFGTMERAAGSPLGERLFALPGVANVLIAESVVTIGKEPSASWSALKAAIGTAIRAHLLTGVPAILQMAAYASAAGDVRCQEYNGHWAAASRSPLLTRSRLSRSNLFGRATADEDGHYSLAVAL